MATANGGADAPLDRELFERGYQFDFFQAVWNLQRMFPQRCSVGEAGPPSAESIRFRSLLSLSFPPSAIREIVKSKQPDRPIEMTVAFMGMTGPQGVLPRHYTELLMERVAVRDHALREFLELFNHRMISLFYRVWERNRIIVGYERSLANGTQDRMAGYLWSLMGLGQTAVRASLGAADKILLRYAGALFQKPHSADALQHILADYFKVRVEIRQFLGMWLQLEPEDLSRLGTRPRNNELGLSTVLGTAVWDQQAKFNVRVGPLSYREFSKLLPSGSSYPILVQMTKFFAGPDLDFSVNLVCQRDEVPVCTLRESASYAPRLGWTTWLKTADTMDDDEKVVFSGTAQFEALQPA